MIINYLRGRRLFDLQWRKRTATAGDAQAYWNSTGLISKLPGSIKSSLSSSLFLLLDEKFFCLTLSSICLLKQIGSRSDGNVRTYDVFQQQWRTGRSRGCSDIVSRHSS
jgi:hypothetical protein